MLKIQLDKQKQVKWPVEVSEPNNGGNFTKKTLTCTFSLMPKSKVLDVMDDGSDAINKVIFDRALMGWDLMDDKGKAVPCDKEHKDIVLDIAYIADAISHAYLYMSRGARAQEKN